ncbi:MAG: HEAT repeat domain-containing protein [Clostridiales bacterium]
MDIEGNWTRIKTHRRRFSSLEIQGLAETLFRGQEDWLGEKLRRREDQALALEFLGCLGRSGSPKAVALLLKYLEEREEVLQLAAAAALKVCPPALILEPLAQIMLRQNHSSVKAGEVLLALGPEGADSLWNLWFVTECPGGLKAQILQLLAEIKDERCQDLAFLALMSGGEELVRAALKAAEKLEMKDLWGNVAGYLKHPSWRLRGRAVLLLGSWGEGEALPYLREMGEDPDPWVEEERQKAISKINERTEC